MSSEEEQLSPSILWRTLSAPGHETAKIYGDDSEGWTIDGACIFLHEGEPVRLDYLVECDADWNTTFATVVGWVGDEIIEVEITVQDGEWKMNGERISAVDGCTDIDLNFSPVTNTLPIRRLKLKVGETRTVKAAWLRFPSFQLELLEQTYTRIDESTVRYEAASGFAATLTVDEDALVTNYPDGWTVEDDS
jgi:hypothetical protein